MRAELVSIGTELLLGAITDTNATYLAQRLALLGIDCYFVSAVGDNQTRLVEVLNRAWQRSDLIVTTGGLGPTGDDLTREAIAEMLHEAPYVVPELEANLRTFFTRRGAPMPERNIKQATLIPSATTLDNPVGTAPGWWVEQNTPAGRRVIVSMPGVPYEMKRMWEHEVETRLRAESVASIVSRTLKVLGHGESAVEEMVADLMRGSNPTLAPYAKQDGIHLRITAKASTSSEAVALIEPMEAQVRERLGDSIYGVDDDTLPGVIGRLAEKRGTRFATVEVGARAAGSLSQPLGVAMGWQGGVALRSLYEAEAFGIRGTSLREVAAHWRELTDADAVLAVELRETSLRDGGLTVGIDATIVLVDSTTPDREALSANPAWRTSVSEVPRLVGLAGFNLLRQWLLRLGT
jgi:nicotinamide-nucleotide amidase